MGQLAVAFRMAGRQARRQRLRAGAIVATLALPIAGATAVDVVVRTTHLSRAEQVNRELGGAQALVEWAGYSGKIVQAPDPARGVEPTSVLSGSFPAADVPAPEQIPPALLPPGTSVTPEIDSGAQLISDRSAVGTAVTGVDVRSTAYAPLVRLDSGRAPSRAGEVALTPALAHQLAVGPGAVIRVEGSALRLRVTGIIRDRFHPDSVGAYMSPAAADELPQGLGASLGHSWFLSSTAPVGWPEVLQMNSAGFSVTSRFVVLHPPPRAAVPFYGPNFVVPPPSSSQRVSQVGAAVLGGMLVVEVVLLAGPAFAVGARRRRDELSLVWVAGGSRRHLVAVVATDGVVLGAAAAAAGVVVGIGVGVLSLAGLHRWGGEVPGPVTIRGWEMAGLAGLAVLTGLLAALVPAIVVSTSARRETSRRSLKAAAVGALMVAIAVGLALDKFDERSSSGAPLPLIAAAALAEVGFALLSPAMLAAAGRLAARAPLWPRLALRDASRNRNAAAPAVAAIVAVVASAAAVLVYASATAAHDRRSYLPSTPVGDAVAFPGNSFAGSQLPVLSRVRADLPGATVIGLQGEVVPRTCTAANSCRQLQVVPQPSPACPTPPTVVFGSGAQGGAVTELLGGDCNVGPAGGNIGNVLIVSGPSMAVILGGRPGRDAAAALERGDAVVFSPDPVSNGRVRVDLGPARPAVLEIPAVAVQDPALPSPIASIIVPPTEATTLGLSVGATGIYIKDANRIPAPEIRAADSDLARASYSELSIERGFRDHISPWLLVGSAGVLLLTLLVAVAATALIGADSQDDLLTLAAVGAEPRVRRRLAMARAGLICLVGSLFGVAAGLLPGIGLIDRARRFSAGNKYPLSIPWSELAVVVLAAPLVAALAAALITRPRLPAERRRPT